MKYKLKMGCVAWFSPICEETDFFMPAPESVNTTVSHSQRTAEIQGQSGQCHDLHMELVVVVQKIYWMDGWMKVLGFMSVREQFGTTN